ncbi:uncharacterized protein N7515_009196 [Penicillium bovifimosum]|uniref:Uncharacterized protein n=1 Tax=Penicillium bovifimosum TaxID=126998 RepID=A0A9W9KVT2_9EURO|nr:uncharacterized protein N7515_009196 [Penicillium bovifimosum]KAJ5121235.1 hypothetical protein N7515_009196 [Penicillium bovifimosum]
MARSRALGVALICFCFWGPLLLTLLIHANKLPSVQIIIKEVSTVKNPSDAPETTDYHGSSAGESDLDAEPSAEHEVEIDPDLDPETPAEVDLDAETHESEDIELEEYLENMSKKSSTSPETEVDTPAEQDEYFEDLLAMTLKITNKVNGEPVERPNRLGAQGKWTVDYELDEMDVKRGNDILRMCKRRRRLIFERSEDEEGVNSRNKEYLARLQKMAKQGRMHRQKERRKDRQQGIVYEDLSGSGNLNKGPNKKVKG